MVFSIAAIVLALVTIAVKWVSIARIRDLNAALLEAQTGAMTARNRLKVALNEKAGTERKITVTGRNNQAIERHLTTLLRELEGIQAHAEEQAEITRQKLSLAEDLKRRSGPLR